MGENEAPPMFNAPAFGRELKRHMRANGLRASDLAKVAGFGVDRIYELKRGAPAPGVRQRFGQKTINPSINTLVRLAFALDLRLTLLLTWGGLLGRGERFTSAEKVALSRLLGGEPEDAVNRFAEYVEATTEREVV